MSTTITGTATTMRHTITINVISHACRVAPAVVVVCGLEAVVISVKHKQQNISITNK